MATIGECGAASVDAHVGVNGGTSDGDSHGRCNVSNWNSRLAALVCGHCLVCTGGKCAVRFVPYGFVPIGDIGTRGIGGSLSLGAGAMMRTSTWRLGLILGVMFGAGLLMGSLGTLIVVSKVAKAKQDSATWGPWTVRWLDRQLDLSDEQQTKIQPLIDEMVSDLKGLRDKADEERKAILGRLFIQLADHLTTEQQTKLNAVIAAAKGPAVGK